MIKDGPFDVLGQIRLRKQLHPNDKVERILGGITDFEIIQALEYQLIAARREREPAMDFRLDIIIEDGKVLTSFVWPLEPAQARALFGEIPPRLDQKSALQPILATPNGDIFVQVTRIM